ncbi:MAG TPA: zinc-binding dehydrogenase [Chlamydiales bacterium]|nr:zinc-binding dehydrogenase [Chlamydiales bacterium]
MQTQAAILVEQNRLVIDELTLPPLKPGQVLVEIKYSGICHTQLLEVRGSRGHDPYLPHCLGHEGSGVVLEIGPKVEKVKPGDSVILSWMKGSGANVPGSIFDWKGKKVNAGAITTFSRHSILSENRLTPISPDFPMKEAALIGCAVPTGLGVVLNTAQPKSGESLAVFGCGGIGLCALLGAQLMGCVPRIAVDINPQKLAAAKAMGATHCIDASKEDPVAAIQKIGPLDFAIEASGSPIAMNQALKSVRSQGGTAVIVGNAHFGQQLSLDPKEFNQGKRLLGTWGGDNQPDIHFPRYCNLINYGHLSLAPFTQKTYSLNQVDQALSDLESGQVLRPLLDMSL